MNNIDRTLLASFLAQRHEMGEREWNIDPGAINALFHPRTPEPEAVEHSTRDSVAGETTMHRSRSSAPDSTTQAKHRNQNPSPAQTGSDTGAAAAVTPSLTGPLAELNDAVSGCERCKLSESRNHFVFGEGNSHADIMFIGEAPGADEDRMGRPFVGRAGRLLTKMIESIRLSREDVFIANILKCRPPGNRDPQRDEIEQCEPILLRQIELIRPHIICALGRISGQTLLRSTATLGSLRGRVHDYHGVKLIVTYHPAALLRNQQWKRPAWEDLKFLRREYDGLEL